MFDSSLQRIRGITGIPTRQQELSARVARLAPFDGTPQSVMPSLALIRSSVPTVCMPTIFQPCLAIVVQGRKSALLNDEVFHYDPLNYLVVSVTLSGMGQVLEATPEHPYLSLRLNLDLEEIARLVLELGDRGASPAVADRGLFVARLDEPLLDAVLRMVKLRDPPGETGGAPRGVRATEWVKQHYSVTLRIEELAEAGHMSPSALHHRFKAVTAMSPLQYQKHLRLHEARRLMFADGIESATAGHRVGYESPSQFSREYRRLFGAPPRVEIARLRDTGVEA